MNLFKRFRERAKRAAAAIAGAGRRLFNRKGRTQEAQTIQEKTREKYTPKASDWGKGWAQEREEALKEKDMLWRKDQQEKAYKTFAENYGMSRQQYDEFFDGIGASMDEISQYIEGGSPTVIYAYMDYQKNFKDGSPEEFLDLFRKVANESTGATQEDLANNLFDALDMYKEYNDKLGGDLTDFMELFDFVKSEYPGLDREELKERFEFEVRREAQYYD